jgi:hypothetical protein
LEPGLALGSAGAVANIPHAGVIARRPRPVNMRAKIRAVVRTRAVTSLFVEIIQTEIGPAI